LARKLLLCPGYGSPFVADRRGKRRSELEEYVASRRAITGR